MAHRLGEGPSQAAGGWVGEYTSPDGLIRLVVNEEEYDWHIDAKEGYSASLMRSVLLMARQQGLELLDEEEGEAEIIDEETMRIYLCPRPASTPELRVVA
ncbi:hypothetical protein KGG85_gp30 [Streptomyces phage Tefunt]|uniref:Uncharacterized protein n=1 Tax=Streptomyces phage Tefunt TaxID=2041209 RepID=A0A291LHV2_9CAUD|nr:hypothetical protein KGG85_gp30 [Streptomyces phage Tefunt]ATI18970.1 hypothetical protein SEA_TEFUNT_30 [Streptomyces phage Tefunt]AXH70234.1 hypothetical protein SEA_HAIZUM_30 [Streptomyces phage Haizum]QAY15771.1 hypothetical protein SEA_NISHIKIGOI_30 [Streptomyces phage Nishikigoi]